MDNLIAILMASIAIAGLVDLAGRSAVYYVIRWATYPAIFWLVVYVILALRRVRPEFWTGDAQFGWMTIALMAFGLIALLSRSSDRSGNGGGLSKC